ncbi:MAG: hypothetical protein E3J72_15575 [Planctomycetota bacterium]|nr:MAG: hypothetical protein E3J72_15575 [Planctomycetota bacterium]
MKNFIYCFSAFFIATGVLLAGCSAPDLVWLAKSGANEHIEWTRYSDSQFDHRREIARALENQEPISKEEYAGLRKQGERRLFFVTTGDLIPPKAKHVGEEKTIEGRRYRLKYQYFVYDYVTLRQDAAGGPTSYFRTHPETIELFDRIGPKGGDKPETPESGTEEQTEQAAEPEPTDEAEPAEAEEPEPESEE